MLDQLKAEGYHVDEADVAHLWPARYAHINPYGKYRFSCPFLDADALHPRANLEKMQRGIALNDEDRLPWLQRLQGEIQERLASGA